MSQKFICFAYLSFADQCTDTSAADARSFCLFQWNGANENVVFLAVMLKKCNVTHSVMPKAKICANYHSFNREMSCQVLHEVTGAHSCDCRRKFDDDIVCDLAVVFGQCQFFFQCRQIAYVDVWPHYHECMWGEGD